MLLQDHRFGPRQNCAREIAWIQALIASPLWVELNTCQQRLWLEKLAALESGPLKN